MNMSKLTFGSVCSGIEAASMAWRPLGWEASWLSEIEPFPSAVLKHHYPDTPNYGDMTLLPDMVLRGEIEAPDVLVGGTPCQSFSVAGMREGLSDERGQLTIKYVELANAIDTIRRRDGKDESIIVWENVPGVLSSKDNAFGCFIAALAGGSGEARSPGGGRWANAGYVLGPQRAAAWRVLDAKYFGLAQRRKRVFVVASAREDICPAEILFEFDGVRRDTAPSREAGKEIAGDVGAGFTPSSFGGYRAGVGTLRANGGDLGGGSETLVAGYRMTSFGEYADDDTASTMKARDYKDATDLVAYGIPGNWIGRKPENGGNSTQFMHEIAPNQTATDGHGVIAFSCKDYGADAGPISPTLRAMGHVGSHANGGGQVAVAFNGRQDPVSGEVAGALDTSSPQAQAVVTCATKQQAMTTEENMASTLAANDYKEPQAVAVSAYRSDTAVRRLTPVECERLQGFPDNWTKIPWRNKPAEDCPDGHRYKALGNSMAVPCMTWLGERINAFLP